MKNAFEIDGSKAFVEKLVVECQKAHGQKAAGLEHSSIEAWDGMDLGGKGKSKLLRERFRSEEQHDRGGGERIFRNSIRASDILLRTANRRSDGESIGKLGRRQRNRP